MNRILYRKILIPLLFGTLILFTINFQTTLWFGFFGYIPHPVIWPSVFVYLMTNRETKPRTAWLIFIFIILCSHTVAIPLSIFLALTSLAFLIRFTQKRFSTMEISDLIAFSFISTILFPLLYSIFSSFNYPHEYNFWQHATNALLTIPFIPVVLYLCKKIDRILNTSGEGILLVEI